MTYIVFNNEVYGLTKGQASPTLQKGMKPKSLPLPNINRALNPIALALACGYTFIARSYAFDAKHLKATIQAAIAHKGVALIDVLQPCPTYNDIHTKEYFSGSFEDAEGVTYPRTYYLEDRGYDGKVKDPTDPHEVNEKMQAAFTQAHKIEEQVALGVYFQIELPTYSDMLKENLPLLREYEPIDLPYHDANMHATTDLTSAMEDYLL
jgi:2-oxoglutarate ferredoxin oxidoreductase subunit beta